MTTPFPNLYHVRTVAEKASKACFICYKPTTRVLITPNDKDFFYVCPGHLTDAGFASPVVDAEPEAAKAKREALDREIENVKREYEEKRKKRRKNKMTMKQKEKEEGKKEDGKEKEDEAENKKAEEERDEKIKSIKTSQEDQSKKAEDDDGDSSPRIFNLHRDFYRMRLDRLRNAEMAKRSQQRVKDPTFFPAAPKGDPL